MKKLVYLIIMSLLLTLVPVDSAEAATKVSGPTVTPVYDKKLDDFKYKFTHPNKNAVIYYRGVDTKKWKRAKNGQTLKLGYFERLDGIYVYAKVGRTKSKARYCNLWTLDDKMVDSQIKKEMSNIINKGDNKATKFLKLIDWFQDNYEYTLKYYNAHKVDAYEGNHTFFRRSGECGALAKIFKRYCTILGIRADYVTSYDNLDYKYEPKHAWCHVYLDKYPIMLDPSSLVEDGAYEDIVRNRALDYDSYDKSKYQFDKSTTFRYKYVYNNKVYTANTGTWTLIVDEGTTNVKITNGMLSMRLCEEIDRELVYTDMIFKYYEEDKCWYASYYEVDGTLIKDDKAEVDAWYAAHPEVKRR